MSKRKPPMERIEVRVPPDVAAAFCALATTEQQRAVIVAGLAKVGKVKAT